MTIKLLPCMVIYPKLRVFPSHLCNFFSVWCIYTDFVRMRGCLELPNMCDSNRIPGMLSDVLAANDKNIFPPRKRNIIFFFFFFGGGGGVNCWSGGRGQTNIILLSAFLFQTERVCRRQLLI